MNARPLTLEQIKTARACVRETKQFAAIFGEGNECTLERCLSVAMQFDWIFAARHLLTKEQYRHFGSLTLAAFRGINRAHDKTGQRRRRAMATAFCHAYNRIDAHA